MAGSLIATICVFFAEKHVTSQWGVVLKHPIADDLELYMEKNRLGIKCKEFADDHGLTARENEILLLIARGKHLSQIAGELNISNNTVKTHTRHIYTKLAVNSRNELLVLLGVKKQPAKGTAKEVGRESY